MAALQAHRHRADGMHVDQTDLLAALPDVVGDHRAVGDRIGVGHREYRGVATESRCRRTGLDILGILPAGFAKVRVQVHQARQQYLAGRVDHLGVATGSQCGADLGDLAVRHQNVDRITLPVQPDALDQNRLRYRRRHTLTASSVPTSR